MSNSNRKQKGFTLVELLVTIAILAILAGVCVVSYTSFIERAAISNDEAMVAQLNHFLLAYSVDHRDITTTEELSDMLYQTELTSITVESAKYGYDILFNKTFQKFELLKNNEKKENIGYIAIPATFAPLLPSEGNTDTQTPENNPPDDKDDEVNNTIPNIPNIDDSDSEPNGSMGELANPISIKVYDKTLINFNPEAKNGTFAYIQDEILYVGVSIPIDTSPAPKYEELQLSDIFSISNAEYIEYSCRKIDHIQYYYDNNKISGTHNIINNTSIKFYEPGTYNLVVTASNNTSNETYSIEVRVANTQFGNAVVDITDVSHELIETDTGTKIEIMDKIIIYEDPKHPDLHNIGSWQDIDNTKKLSFINERMKIVIYINGIEQTFELTREFDDCYAKIEGISIGSIDSFSIIYGYLSINGVWVYSQVNNK